MQNGRIVPSLGEIDFTKIEQALQTCETWKLRGAMLPHAIECSYSISNLLYQDFRSSTNSTKNNNGTLHLAYAAVIIRSVNGLADQLQQNRAFAASVSFLCQKLGLPGWIVDLRHESAHNELPSLPRLRLAAHTILLFFHERYWLVVEVHRQEQRNYARKLLQEYLTEAKREQSNNSFSTTDKKQVGKEGRDGDLDDFGDDLPFEDEDTLWLQDNFFAALYQSKEKLKRSKDWLNSENEQKEPAQLSSLEIANLFVGEVKQDVAYFVVVDYMVWSDKDQIFTMEKPQLFRVLLRQICEAWPGFAITFITHCVEYYILHPSHSSTIASWVEIILFDISRKIEIFPLNSLLKRLLSDENNAESLIHVLMKALGKEVNTAERNQKDTTITNWTLVEDWEPCTIGSLPGYAV